MLDLELHAEFSDHGVVEVGTIVSDDPLRDTIPADEVMLDESSHDVLGNQGKLSCFNPLYKVVNGDMNETMPIRGSRLDFSDHISPPLCEWPRSSRDIQRYWRHVNLISIDMAFMESPRVVVAISFNSRPIVTSHQNLLGHSVSAGMSFEDTFMHVFHDLLCFLLVLTT